MSQLLLEVAGVDTLSFLSLILLCLCEVNIFFVCMDMLGFEGEEAL
jgi:hypothetical protein